MARSAILLVVFFVISVSTAHAAQATLRATNPLKNIIGKAQAAGQNRGRSLQEGDMLPPPDDGISRPEAESGEMPAPAEMMPPADPTPKYHMPRPAMKNADPICNDMMDMGDDYCRTFSFLTYMCPVTCGMASDDDSFCSEDQNEAMEHYWDFLEMESMDGASLKGALSGKEESACKLIAPGAMYDMQIAYDDGPRLGPCSSPQVALLCPESCHTNCWSFPPMPTTKVVLPSCGSPPQDPSVLEIATPAHRLNRNRMVSGDPPICPPR